MLTPDRIKKLKDCVRRRQRDMTVILENVHDPHNIGACLRSCEAVGINEVYILYTKETSNEEWYIGRNAATGVTKWLNPRFYTNLEECFHDVRKKYGRILATHLKKEAQSLYKLDLNHSFAFLFGNEHDGISDEALSKADGNFVIPIMGLIESLNVSVACSISVFEAMRQRSQTGCYDKPFQTENEIETSEFKNYVRLSKPRIYNTNEKLLDKDVDQFMKL